MGKKKGGKGPPGGAKKAGGNGSVQSKNADQGKENAMTIKKRPGWSADGANQHQDPLAMMIAAVDNFNNNGDKKAPAAAAADNNNSNKAPTQSKKNKNKKKKDKKNGANNSNSNAAADSSGVPQNGKQQNNNSQAQPQPLMINGVEISDDLLRQLPTRKKGETKKQWQKRVGLVEHEVDEDGGFVAHPPADSQRLDVDRNDYEEEQPEDSHDGSETNDDFSDTQNERAREYKKGGYHPVIVNELYHERYRVVHKLGWGYFSTVWLVWDYQSEHFQAMKVQKSAQHYREAAFDEIKLLDQIMKGDPKGEQCCARMTDSFEHKGPHGVHVCMLFDLLGENLLSLGERYENRGIPLPIVKSIARETLIGLHHIHSLGIIHTDIKPENVLLSSPKHKIHALMKKYVPPPMGDRPSLLERDVRTMTKSQRRRYYQKAKQAKAKSAEDPDVEGAAAAAASKKKDDVPTADKKQEGKKKAGPADGADSDATVSDLDEDAEKKDGGDEKADDDAASETDQEWEVERFHHVSLADFGNSCWIDLQFTDEVQTRQYRAPEVIIGDPYSCPIDLWSAAAMFFELLTGEFLFDPKSSGDYPRDEDHLALISELMGDLPEHMASSDGKGKYRAQFYNSQGRLRHINELRYWDLKNVLHEKYRYTRKKAHEIASFLEPMLNLDPQERATAEEMLVHFKEWFDVQEDDYSPLCFVGEHDDEDEDNEHFDDDVLVGGGHRETEFNDDEEFEEFEEEEEEELGPLNDSADDAEEDEDAPSKQPKTKKVKKVHRRRTTRHTEEDDLAWFQEKECLQPESLAALGLTIDDIKEVLSQGQLEDPEKDAAAQLVLEELMSQQ